MIPEDSVTSNNGQQADAAGESGENEDEEEERRVVGEILIPEEWNAGDFELNINRCS